MKRKPVAPTTQSDHPPKSEKLRIPPPLPPRRGSKPQSPPVPPRPPPRRKSEVKAAEESPRTEETDIEIMKKGVEPESSEKASIPNEGIDEPKVDEPKVDEPKVEEPKVEESKVDEPKVDEAKRLENDAEQKQSDRGTGLGDESRQLEATKGALLNANTPDNQDSLDSSQAQKEDIVPSQGSLKESTSISSDKEDTREPTIRISISPANQKHIRCICGTESDDGKMTYCESCDTWQHAECYYIDEFGIVPTNQDLNCIDHYCAECAPRVLHVEEAIARKRSQQAEIDSKKSRDAATIKVEPQAEPVDLDPKTMMSKPEVDNKPASSAVEELTSEMDIAFGEVHFPPPIIQTVSLSPGSVKPPSDTALGKTQEDSQGTEKPPPSIDRPTIEAEHMGSLREDVKPGASPAIESSSDDTSESAVEPSKESTVDSPADKVIPASGINTSQDDCEETSKGQGKQEPPTIPNLAPPSTSDTLIETPKSKIDERNTLSQRSANTQDSTVDPISAESRVEGNGLDTLIQKIRLSRIVSKETTQAQPPSTADSTTQPKLSSGSPPALTPLVTTLVTGHSNVADTEQGGRDSSESRSITISTPPPPQYPPPLPPTVQLTPRSGNVESVISTESSGRTSSTFDAASTVSSEFPEVNTVLTSNETAPTMATSLEVASTQTTRTRAQSDLRRLQTELSAAKERGDSKAKEDSIQQSIQVIWDTYLSPQPEEAVTPKKSPRLANRASFLRMPTLTGSAKTRIALVNAINYDDEASIRKLLDEKVNVNGRSETNETPLMIAASLGHVKSMRLLKEYGADEFAKDARGRTALHIAVAYNHELAVKWLLEAYAPAQKPPSERTSKIFRAADLARGSRAAKNLREIGDADGSTALHVAAHRGMGGMLKILTTSGVDVEAKDSLGRTPLLRSILSQKQAPFDVLLEGGANIQAVDSRKASALHFAAAAGQVNIIELLLSKGVDRHAADNDGAQALHHAGRNGQIAAVNALITSQADLNTPTKTGERLLHIASAHNKLPLVEHLLTSNVDVNPFATPVPGTLKSQRPIGTQLIPLHYACILGHLEICMILLKHMAWVNAPTDTGVTALMMAADNGDTNLVNILIEAGAKVNASVPGTCLTALHISARKGDLETVQQLCRAGANEGAKTSGEYGRTPIEEATKYAPFDKKILVIEYMRILHNNKMLAKRKMAPQTRPMTSSNLSIQPGPGTPMAAQQNAISPQQWHPQLTYSYPTNILANGFGTPNLQDMHQFGMVYGPPPLEAGQLQQPFPSPHQPQQPPYQYPLQPPQRQPQYYDPMNYGGGIDTLPPYEPGPGAPVRLAARPGVHRPNP